MLCWRLLGWNTNNNFCKPVTKELFIGGKIQFTWIRSKCYFYGNNSIGSNCYCFANKLRWITQPAIAICQKLADSKITCVSTYGKSMVIFQVFRLKKVLSWISICVSMCEILDIQANLVQSRYCDSCEPNLGLSLLSSDST